MKKRGLLAVLLIAVMTLLCGCGGMSAEDAQSYAKSIMDASYKGEFDKYVEWTKSSKEEANYEVGEAKEAGDKAYTVDVTVKPFTGFDGLQAEVEAATMAELENVDVTDQNAVNELVFQKMYDIMVEKVASPTFGEPTTVTINVKPDSDGVYFIDQTDMTALDDALFPSDAF